MSAKFLKAGVPFFEGITMEQAELLMAQAERKSYSKGQTVVLRGTTVDGLYVIDSGSVSVLVKPPKGKEAVQVAALGPGDVFGETSIVDNSTAGATVKALEDETSLLIIPQDALREVLAQNAEVAARVRALIDSRKKKTSDSLVPVPA